MGKVDLQAGVAGIGAVREAAQHLLERTQRQFGHARVALDVGDLLVEAQRLEIIGVADVAVRRVELDEAVHGHDRVVVFVVLVMRVGRHQLGLRRPG